MKIVLDPGHGQFGNKGRNMLGHRLFLHQRGKQFMDKIRESDMVKEKIYGS